MICKVTYSNIQEFITTWIQSDMHFIIVLSSLTTTHEIQSPIGGGSGWPEGRLLAAKVCLAVLASGLDGRAAGGADVVEVEAARSTEVHPVREAITATG